jgi:hypothetical protein
MITDDPSDPDAVARLANTLFRTLAQSGASHSDGYAALVRDLLTAAVETAKSEAEAVERVAKIAEELWAKVQAQPRHKMLEAYGVWGRKFQDSAAVVVARARKLRSCWGMGLRRGVQGEVQFDSTIFAMGPTGGI